MRIVLINILFEDKYIIVCEKPMGIISEHSQNPREKSVPSLLQAQTKTFKIDVVHRLDKAVGGVMVFSKNKTASAALSKAILNRELIKEYLAVVPGCPENQNGTWRDFLFRDKQKNKSFVVKTERKGAKEAILDYEILKTAKVGNEDFSLLKIRLHTGRTHQIRVQCASRGMPLLGDKKYGSKADIKDIALWSHHLCFAHPQNKKPVDITLPPPNTLPWKWFK